MCILHAVVKDCDESIEEHTLLLQVCMYICIYMYTYMYVPVCIRGTRVYVCTLDNVVWFVHMYTCVCMYVHTCVHVCISESDHILVDIHVATVFIHKHNTHTHTHTHKHAHIQTYTGTRSTQDPNTN
jgi:hypothetical protein